MGRIIIVVALATISSRATASPRIDVFDSDLQYVETINPDGAADQIVRDIQFSADGDMWVLLVDSSHGRNQCNPNDMIKRFSPTGSLVTTYKAGLRNQRGFAINPAGGYWVSAITGCGALEGDYLYRVDANDQVVQQTGRISDGLPHLELLPNGRLMAPNWSRVRTYDSSSLSQLSANSTTGSTRYQAFEYSPATGEVLFAGFQSGTGRLETFSTTGVSTGSYTLNQYGMDRPRYVLPLSDGSVHIFEPTSYVAEFITLAAGYGSLDASGALDTSRRSMSAAKSQNGLHYIASWGPDLVESIQVAAQPSGPSQSSTWEISFQTESVIPANAYIEMRVAAGFDFAGASTATWTQGGDSDLSFTDDPWGYAYYYSDPNQPVTVGFTRNGGSPIDGGTPVTISLPGVVNPDQDGSYDVLSVRIYDQLWGDQYAEGLLDLPSFDIVAGLSCEIGSPVDRDGDGDPEICVGTNPTIDSGATIAPLAQIGDNVTIEAGAVVGADAIIRDGSIVAKRAQVGDGVDLGRGTVVSRRAVIEDDVVLGEMTVVGRSATIGSGTVLPDNSAVGYGAVVGRHVSIDTQLVLGGLARLGGTGSSPGAVDCVGPLVIARSSQIATDPDHSLTCLGSATIGPDVTIASGGVLGDRTRFRKGVIAGGSLTTGERVAIGRDAQLENNVSVEDTVRVGARARICDGTTITSTTTARYIDPACTVP